MLHSARSFVCLLITCLLLHGSTVPRAIAHSPSSASDTERENSAGSSQSTAAEASVALLYFTQDRCPPCRQMLPMVEHLIGKGFPIQKVDVTQNAELTEQFRIEATPTFVLIKDGRELNRHSGVLTSYQINSLLIDAGVPTDQDVLSKPTAISPLINFLDRLRPAAGSKAVADSPRRTRNSNPTASIPPANFTAAEKAALTATARIKIQYRAQQQSITDYGTATVIHRQGNDILLLTCGHVFRDSKGQGSIQVELDFSEGEPREIVPGQLLLFDAGAPDVAILAATTRLPVKPMPLAPAHFAPSAPSVVFSVGCDNGQPATVRRGEYLSTVRCGGVHIPGQPVSDVMARKFAVSGRPVVGRSGGGLFSTDGHLIGVCNAAVVGSDEGRYAAIDNVHSLLAEAKLAHLFSPRPADQAVIQEQRQASDRRIASNSGGRQRFYPLLDNAFLGQAEPNGRGEKAPANRSTQLLGQSPR